MKATFGGIMKTADGKAITARAVRRGLRINVVAGAAGMLWAALVMGMPLTMFMESVGASGLLIGLATTVQQLAMLLQIPAAFVSERLVSRKTYWFVTAFLHRALWLLVPFLPAVLKHRQDWIGVCFVLIVGASSMLAQASASAWWSWITDLVPARVRNRFWSSRQSLVFTAHLVGIWIAGLVLDLYAPGGAGGGVSTGFLVVFGIGAVLGCADVVIHMWVPEPRQVPVRRDLNVLQRVVAPLRGRDFRALTLAMGAWALSVGLVGQFGMLYLKREFGISYVGLSSTVISSTLGVIAAGLVWAYVMDRISARNFTIIMLGLAPLTGVAWFLVRAGDVTLPFPGGGWTVSQPVLVMALSGFVGGALYSGVGLGQVSLLGAVAPVEGRTMAMAVHFSVVGLMAAAGPLLGGAVVDHFERLILVLGIPNGARFGFMHLLVLLHIASSWGLALPMLMRLRRKAGELGLGTAVSRFIVMNPFRMASNIVNIHAMAVADSRDDRAEAIRRLGEERAAIAVRDLVAQLDDPSLDVREEAALALGRIGSRDAVVPLMRKLNDPEADMVLEIARALRPVRDARIIPVLLRRLAFGVERAAVVEIVRTLGAAGDQRACEPLIDLLWCTQDAKVMVACSEALARLGKFAAVYEILPRLKSVTPAASRALTVNLGDLFGEPGGFYRVSARESRDRGSEADRLFDRMADVLAEGRSDRGGDAGAMVENLRSAYTDSRYGDAAVILRDLVAAVGRDRFGVASPGDLDAFVDALVCHDECFGVGAWFVGLLCDNAARAGAPQPTELDILLGAYFLAGWLVAHRSDGPTREKSVQSR